MLGIVVVASVIPLVLVGLWLSRTAMRSGERFLQDRVDAAVEATVHLVASQWTELRSELLFVAEDPAIQGLLAAPPADHLARQDRPPVISDRARGALVAEVLRVQVLDVDGDVIVSLPGASRFERVSAQTAPGSVIVQWLSVYRNGTSERIGSLRIELAPGALLPPERVPSTAGGVMMALLDAEGSPVPPLPVELPPGGGLFSWGGDQWLQVRRDIQEPDVTLLGVANQGAGIEPFREAARRGTFLLLLVSAVVIAAATVLTGRITRSLRQLADAAVDVSRGELDRTVEVASRDEIGRVAQAFNVMTERLRHTLDRMAGQESLASVGEFAAGLAHEIRNPLTAVQIDLQFVESQLPEGSPASDAQSKALAEIRRLDSTVRDALRIARSGKVTLRAMDVVPPILAAADASRPLFDRVNGPLDVEVAEGPMAIMGDPDAIEQLVLNLLRNAAEALEPGGRVVLGAQRGDTEVRIVVRDDGDGMPPEVVEKAFEPLFSTRKEGTGLGLPIARKIVQAHDGTIRIRSEAGEGTTVEVRLPALG
jgi:signal transduction histidine kinase